MNVMAMEKVSINLGQQSLPKETQSFYTSLYQYYGLESVPRLHVPHHMLIDSILTKIDIPVDIEKIFYTYDRAQYCHGYKSLGCYVAYRYKLTSNFFDICDQYTMSEYIAFHVIDSYLQEKSIKSVLLISIDSPTSTAEASIYALLVTNDIGKKYGFSVDVCQIFHKDDQDTTDQLLIKFMHKYRIEDVYTNYFSFLDKNIYSYEKTYQALLHFQQNANLQKALIIHFDRNINSIAILHLYKK